MSIIFFLSALGYHSSPLHHITKIGCFLNMYWNWIDLKNIMRPRGAVESIEVSILRRRAFFIWKFYTPFKAHFLRRNRMFWPSFSRTQCCTRSSRKGVLIPKKSHVGIGSLTYQGVTWRQVWCLIQVTALYEFLCVESYTPKFLQGFSVKTVWKIWLEF